MDKLEFDVFCCHNSLDKPEIELIIDKLKRRKIKSWIDKQQILGGQSFQKEIQKVIPKIGAAVIFLSKNGLGTWQDEEIDLLLSECMRSGKLVIPVLLPGMTKVPSELGFLNQRVWVSLEEVNNQSLDELEASILGRKVIEPFFDILLCYREENSKEIRDIERHLMESGIRCWQLGVCDSNIALEVSKLDKQLHRIWSIAVFVGSNGGPWTNAMIEDIIIIDFRQDQRTVIPVILDNIEEPRLPIYLKRLGKVDFRRKDIDPMKDLITGILRSIEY